MIFGKSPRIDKKLRKDTASLLGGKESQGLLEIRKKSQIISLMFFVSQKAPVEPFAQVTS